MRIEQHHKNGYLVLRIMEDLTLRSDMSELRDIIGKKLSKGITHFAIAFTSRTFLFSKYITVLIQCRKMIQEHHGRLAVIQANDHVVETLNIIGLDRSLEICADEQALGRKKATNSSTTPPEQSASGT